MKIAIGASVIAAVLAGCSGGGSSPATVTVTEPAGSGSTATQAASAATPSAPKSVSGQKIGSTVDFGWFTIQVQQYQGQVKTGSGTNIAGVLIRSCVTGDGPSTEPAHKGKLQFSPGPWAVVSADGSRYPSNYMSGGDLPLPSYPMGNVITSKGECVRGWIFFDIQPGVSAVRYQSEDGETAEWAIG